MRNSRVSSRIPCPLQPSHRQESQRPRYIRDFRQRVQKPACCLLSLALRRQTFSQEVSHQSRSGRSLDARSIRNEDVLWEIRMCSVDSHNYLNEKPRQLAQVRRFLWRHLVARSFDGVHNSVHVTTIHQHDRIFRNSVLPCAYNRGAVDCVMPVFRKGHQVHVLSARIPRLAAREPTLRMTRPRQAL